MMDVAHAVAADLYYRTGSVQFGEFELSAHRDNPNLPLSPIYLHYPKVADANPKLLEDLYHQIGWLFVDKVKSEEIWFERVAAVPWGAIPLAESFALECAKEERSVGLLLFDKSGADGVTKFGSPRGVFGKGDRLLVIEDHTSGGRNKKLFLKAAEEAGLEVADILTVVDRQQGGTEAMASEGRKLHSLFTLDELLSFGVEHDYIDDEMVERVREYIKNNQLWTPA